MRPILKTIWLLPDGSVVHTDDFAFRRMFAPGQHVVIDRKNYQVQNATLDKNGNQTVIIKQMKVSE